MRRLAAALALLMTGASAMAAPMTYAEFRERVRQPPAPGPILAYGKDPLQHVELWKPEGKGPFPVVLMIHGGCWQTAVAKADIMHAAAAELVKQRFAVWNVEYRGVDVPGGGYPGTFQDIAAAVDLLAKEGGRLGLDTKHVVAMGHSAGAHLALWLAGRTHIARTSILSARRSLKLLSVVSVGGLPDLASARTEAAGACGDDTIDRLVGRPTQERPDIFADTSPVALMPMNVDIYQINGAEDVIAPPRFAESFKSKATRDWVTNVVVPSAGHFELITPGTDAWTEVWRAIDQPFIVVTGASTHPRPR